MFNFDGKTILALVAAAVVAGCSSSGTIALENPDFFSGRLRDGVMTGAFNEAGYTSRQVQELVAHICESGDLSGFSTHSKDTGLTGFSAECDVWEFNSFYASFERFAEARVLIEITATTSPGNIGFITKEVAF